MQKFSPHNETIIIGLGKTGLSCAKYLIKNGVPITVMDTRNDPPGLAQFRQQFPSESLLLGQFDTAILQQAGEVIVSPGIDTADPVFDVCRRNNIPLIGDIELFARQCRVPIIAITGSNGKSTLASLVYEMAKHAGLNVLLGGNIGVPVLDLIDESADLFVLEISSFQLETTYSLKPTAATILNISPDHLDRYHSLENYLAAKQRIYHQCQTAIWNRDDIKTKSM